MTIWIDAQLSPAIAAWLRHFHAIYGKSEGQIGISPLALIEGKLSGRVLGLAMEWAALHQKELLENWELVRGDKPPRKIPPLK